MKRDVQKFYVCTVCGIRKKAWIESGCYKKNLCPKHFDDATYKEFLEEQKAKENQQVPRCGTCLQGVERPESFVCNRTSTPMDMFTESCEHYDGPAKD